MTLIDLKPLIDEVLFPLLATAITPFVAWAVYKAGQLLHVQLTAAQTQTLETAMQNGINFALSQAQTYADAHGIVPTKSDLIATATNYVLPKVPDALAKLGISPAGVAQRIEARLPPPVAKAAVIDTLNSGTF